MISFSMEETVVFNTEVTVFPNKEIMFLMPGY